MIQDEITLNDLKKMPEESYVLVDMRGSVAFSHGHIPHAVSIPVDHLEEQVWKNENVIIYCSIGEQSREIVRLLREKGVNDCSLKGGFREWLMEEEKFLDKDEAERYSRQIILPEVGIEGQKKLKKARVLIVGAGGLGSPVALYLGAAGIGTIGIADGDVVSMSNLHRQIIHDTASVGISKVDSAKRRLETINPNVQVITYPMPVTADNISEMIQDYDFIIDGADNFQTKFLINDACVIAGKTFCHAGILRFDGQIMTWVPGQGPCYRCIFEDIPEGEVIQ